MGGPIRGLANHILQDVACRGRRRVLDSRWRAVPALTWRLCHLGLDAGGGRRGRVRVSAGRATVRPSAGTTKACSFWYSVVMRRMQMVAERRSLHDPTRESRPQDESPADRIAIVTKLVRTHHGWDDDETRPGLQRVHRVTTRE